MENQETPQVYIPVVATETKEENGITVVKFEPVEE